MAYNQEVDDSDDFDIYADLDDHKIDLNFSDNTADDFVFPDKRLVLDSDLSQIVAKSGATDEQFSEPNHKDKDDIANGQPSDAQTIDDFANYIESCDVKCDNNVSNDLILNEITILESNLHKSQDINKSLESKNEELSKQLELKDKQLLVLKRNISSLFKTAKGEIDRYKRQVDELRSELDSIIFRRLQRKEPQIIKDKPNEDITYSDNSSQTNERDFKPISDKLNSKKSPDSSVKSAKEPNNRRRSRSRSCQRVRRSRSRDGDRRQRNRSRDRNSRSDRNNRLNGIKDDKKSDRKEEDLKRRSDKNDSKKYDSKRTKTDRK